MVDTLSDFEQAKLEEEYQRQTSDPQTGAGAVKFALESSKGAVRQGSGSGGLARASSPNDLIEQCRTEVREDPDVGEAVKILTDYVVGDKFDIRPRNVEGVDGVELDATQIGEVKKMMMMSTFASDLWDMVFHTFQDGVAFMEINWSEKKVFKPRLLPPTKMTILYDEYDRVAGYELQGQEDVVEYGKYEVAHLGFGRHPGEDWHYPLVGSVLDQVTILRDMEVDMARFVATKAYPPILWKLGDETEWSPAELDAWMDDIESIQPDTHMVGPGDVEAEPVGTGDTTTQSGSMDLTGTFGHFQRRISTGLGVLSFMLNQEGQGQKAAALQLPQFNRRVNALRRKVRDMVEKQILHSLFYHENPEEHEGEIVPKFEFGTHSSEEERLEISKLIEMMEAGLIKRSTAVREAGFDPEVDMPTLDEFNADIKPILEAKNGGRPNEVGSEDRSVDTRQNPERDSSDDSDRPQSGQGDES